MIPDGTDISDLSAQLQQDRVAFSNPGLADDPQLNQSIAAHLAEDHAIAVVDVFPQRPADSRDIAQELADATGISTVIVQT
ncbi:MAG: DUF6676 family protein, partial [Corynebacterium sp.]|nr:DUF6676 family protein [Corynebacterium sp.]